MFLLQQRVEYFKPDNPVAGYTILIGLGVILAAIFITNLVRNGISAGKRGVKRSGGSSRFSIFAFHRVVKKYRLNRDQAKVLEFVLKSNGVADPENTVANPTVLDKHFKRAYKQIEATAKSEEEAQQKQTLLFSVRNMIDMVHNTSAGAPSSQHVSSGMSAILSVNQDSFPVKVISSRAETVLVDCPKNAIGTLIKFPKGTRVNLAFFSKNNKGFSLESQVTGMADTSFGPAIQLTHSKQIKSMTQRRFRRKQAVLNCDFYMVRIDDSKSKKTPKMTVDPHRMSGSVTDISIGGCAIKTQLSIPPGSRLKIEFDYAHSALPVAVLGLVLRTNRSGIANIIVHIKFLKVPQKAMNVINSLVFEYSD